MSVSASTAEEAKEERDPTNGDQDVGNQSYFAFEILETWSENVARSS